MSVYHFAYLLGLRQSTYAIVDVRACGFDEVELNWVSRATYARGAIAVPLPRSQILRVATERCSAGRLLVSTPFSGSHNIAHGTENARSMRSEIDEKWDEARTRLMLQHLRPTLRCREIIEADLAATAELLSRSFRDRDSQLLQLRRLAGREVPSGVPRFGYLLEHDGRPVGAILTIYSSIATGGTLVTRCNLSSWHVEPEYKGYGALLISQALKRKDVTYLNVTARPSTWPIVAAQGFSRYSNGIFVAAPLLSRRAPGIRTTVVEGDRVDDSLDTGGLDPRERSMLSDHARFGCLALVCNTGEGTHPFIFARRDLKNLIPCVQLVYCRSIDEFVRFAGSIARVLAKRGIFLVTIDANRPITGLVGRYYPGKMPKFIKGKTSIRLGDLAYTNIAMFCDL
jgi:hypothetical protein